MRVVVDRSSKWVAVAPSAILLAGPTAAISSIDDALSAEERPLDVEAIRKQTAAAWFLSAGTAARSGALSFLSLQA